MKNRSYIIVFTVLLAIALGTYQLIIPQFSTKAYSRETVENISQGITTTSTVDSAGNQVELVDEDSFGNTNEPEPESSSCPVIRIICSFVKESYFCNSVIYIPPSIFVYNYF